MGPDVLVLGYHAVSESWPSPLAVSPDLFEAQLELLAERGYRGARFLDAITQPPGPRTVAITFDDAYKSVLDLAAPRLAEHGFPATVFVPSAFPGSGQRLEWDGIDHWMQTEHEAELETMSWDQLGELGECGWEIGSHTRTHAHLSRLDDAALADELRGSREDVERALGRPCRTLAYPYGEHDDRVVAAADAAGYEAAATLPVGLRERGLLRWPRIGIYPVDTTRRFRRKVSPTVRLIRASPAWNALRRTHPG